MESINLDLGNRSYDILIGKDILKNNISSVIPLNRCFIITDENVAANHLNHIKNILIAEGKYVIEIILPAGEKTKSFENLQSLINEIFKYDVERKDTLIALGGGVIGDLVGFAASIILRGINFIQIPTTILAQVDSSVGGKTAINIDKGKNLIGSFYQPKRVVADISFIETLNERHLLSGYAEIVKYGLINDKEFFNFLDDNVNLLNNRDEDYLVQIIKKSCLSKAQIVSEDERESGSRALLNLGHTFGHAFEKRTNYSDKLFHGEAVAIGMVMAYRFSEYLGNKCEADKVESHLKKVGLKTRPSDIGSFDVDDLISDMMQDKKVDSGKMVFILLKSIGNAYIEKNIEKHVLKYFLINYGI